MERREFTKFHLYMIIAALVGIITIVWAVVSIKDIKEKEATAILKPTEKPVVEEIIETTEAELPEDMEEPDLTLSEYHSMVGKTRIDNTHRYSIEELNTIINKHVAMKDTEGNPVELTLSTENSLEDALITSNMFETCMSIWQPKENCVIVIAKPKTESLGKYTENMREYLNFMERSSSTNVAINTFRYFETYSYNNFTVFLACNNAMDLSTALQNYMINKDTKAVSDFEGLYELTEYGAYLKDIEEETTVDDIITFPGNITDPTVFDEIVEESVETTEEVVETIEENTETVEVTEETTSENKEVESEIVEE